MTKFDILIRMTESKVEQKLAKVEAAQKWVKSSMSDIENDLASGGTAASYALTLSTRAAELAIAASELESAKQELENLRQLAE